MHIMQSRTTAAQAWPLWEQGWTVWEDFSWGGNVEDYWLLPPGFPRPTMDMRREYPASGRLRLQTGRALVRRAKAAGRLMTDGLNGQYYHTLRDTKEA